MQLSSSAPAERVLSSRRTRYTRTWRVWLPSGFVVFSLLVLLLVPMFVQRRVNSLRQEMTTVAEPAHTLMSEIQLAFAKEAAAIRALRATQDLRFADRYVEAFAVEQRAFAQVLPLTAQLEPMLTKEVLALRRDARQWHAPIAVEGERPVAGRTTLAEVQTYDRLLADADSIKRAIDARIASLRAATARTEEWGVAGTLFLALLAFASAIVVAAVGNRYRRQAFEEAALHDAGLALTAAAREAEVLHRIARVAVDAGYGDAAYVERVDADRAEVAVVAVAGSNAPPLGSRVPLPGSLTPEAERSGLPERVPNLHHTRRPIAALLPEGSRAAAALVLPLSIDHETQGALVILRSANRPYRDSELERPATLAILAALALRKAFLLRAAQTRNRELQKVTESRARLIRGFSHDVKNPLGAADGYAELLEDDVLGRLNEAQRDGVRRIRAALGSAIRLIEDLLDLARSEAGQLTVHREDVDVPSLLRDVAKEYGAAAEAAGLRLVVNLAHEPLIIRSDARRLRQILSNLVSNAIKYTPAGGRVELNAEVTSSSRSDDSPHFVLLAVSDTGPGIPLEKRAVLFREFTRLDPAASRGAGVGLAISQRIANALGGKIEVAGAPGSGSTFTLRLPLTDTISSSVQRSCA